jgi:lysophospholipase L1-like esterase
MSYIKVIVLSLICCAVTLGAEKEADKTSRWENDIQQFEAWDRKNSYPKDGVLFVGSSSIRMWPTRESFEELPVINRGFGGSQISDSIHFFERIVKPYRPAVVVLYAGDNDIAGGKISDRVFEDYKKFVSLVHESLPKTPVIFVGIKPSGSRWSMWPAMNKANEMVADFCKKDRRLMYFDSATPILGADGKPRDDLFLKDRLHLNAEGYKAWTKALAPQIEKALKNHGS